MRRVLGRGVTLKIIFQEYDVFWVGLKDWGPDRGGVQVVKSPQLMVRVISFLSETAQRLASVAKTLRHHITNLSNN